jgi:hypothetical protein
MLDKICLRFQKKEHEGFANPVKGSQSDSSSDHGIHDAILFRTSLIHLCHLDSFKPCLRGFIEEMVNPPPADEGLIPRPLGRLKPSD